MTNYQLTQGMETSFSEIWNIISLSSLVCLRKYDHATEEKADCGAPKVSKRLKSALFQMSVKLSCINETKL